MSVKSGPRIDEEAGDMSVLLQKGDEAFQEVVSQLVTPELSRWRIY